MGETDPQHVADGRPNDDVGESELNASLRELRSRGPDLAFRIVLVALLVWLVAPMALPLVLGGLAAIVLHPVDTRLAARLGRARFLASTIVTTATVLGVLVPVVWVIIRVVRALNAFASSLMASGGGSSRERVIDLVTDVVGGSIDHASVAASFDGTIRKIATAIGGVLANVAKSLPDAITSTFLFVLALYFGLRDGPKLVQWARRVSPVSRSRTNQLFEAVRRTVNGTMLGMLAVALVQGSLATIALVVCRVEHAMLWGFIAAICSAIPIVGTTPVTVGAAGFLYLQHRPVAALAMLGAAVMIGLSDNVVRPWVQSQHDDMHPLLALLAIFGGLALFGPAGLLLGPVIAAMAVWAVETYAEPSGKSD